MRKRLRKKLGLGEFQKFYFQATLSVQSPDRWPIFTEALGDFMSNMWKHWGFGYGEYGDEVSELRFLISVGRRDEAESRRTEMIRWLEQQDVAQFVSATPVDFNARVYRLSRRH
jgi:uncharacterized protein YggL (DUF469 family)